MLDVYSLIEDEIEYPSFKHKMDKLLNVYGGHMGLTTVFNQWVQLTTALLDNSLPMASQFAKLNETRVNLSNARMEVSHLQFCFILLNALPLSYDALADRKSVV